MKWLLKLGGSLVVIALALVIIERWYEMFYLGRLFESVNIGFALLGAATPVAAVAVAMYLIIKIFRA